MSTKVASIYAELGIDSKKFTTGLNTASSGLGNFKSGIGGMLSAVGGIGLALGGAKLAIEGFKKALEFSKEGASIERLEESSQMMAKTMGINMDDIVKAVREASLGTVSDLDIMASATKALMLGVGTSAEQMAGLMEVAAIRGRAMGLSTTQAFNDIVTGIGRQSKLILDNLGIVLNLEQVYGDYAKALGITADALTDNEKKEAMVQAVILDTQGLLETTGGLLEDNLTKWEQMKSAETNYWNEVKKSTVGLSALFGDLVGGEYDSALLELQFKNIKKAAKELGIDIKDITKEMPNFFNPAGPMELEEAIWRLQTRVALAEGGFTTAEKSMMDYYATLYKAADGVRDLTEAEIEAQIEIATKIATIRDLGYQYGNVLSYAELYTDVQKETAQNQLEINSLLKGFNLDGTKVSAEEAAERIAELRGETDLLYGSLKSAENQMVLNMLQATLAVDGFTAAEAKAMLQLQVDMGIITQDAMTRSLEMYNDTLDKVNGIKEEMGKDVTFTVMGMYGGTFGIPDFSGMTPLPNGGPVTPPITEPTSPGDGWVAGDYGGGKHWRRLDPDGTYSYKALGGPAYAGNPYIVGESGPEPFIPEVDGRILSRSDAMLALSEGRGGKGDTYNYNLTMPTTADPVDVGMAFEILKAYGGR